MSSVAALRQLTMGTILLAMLGMSLSLSLHQKQRTAPGEKLGDTSKNIGRLHQEAGTTKKSTHSIGGKLGDNVKVFEPAAQPLGSLILLMGIGGDHSWTMSEWWYLDTAWSPKEQEWCRDSCWFDDNDKAAVQRLRNNLRIVDAVGTIWYRQGTSWYKYQWWPDGPPVAADHENAIANVFRLIEHEYKIVGSYERIAIAGMSQGADLALSVGVRYPHQLGMVISQRGMLHEPSIRHGNMSTAFLLTGGDADELVPLTTLKGSCASLLLTHTPAYLKTHTCYDGETWGCHGSFSKTEWKLLINAFSLMLYPVHERNWGEQLGHLTFWESCVA